MWCLSCSRSRLDAMMWPFLVFCLHCGVFMASAKAILMFCHNIRCLVVWAAWSTHLQHAWVCMPLLISNDLHELGAQKCGPCTVKAACTWAHLSFVAISCMMWPCREETIDWNRALSNKLVVILYAQLLMPEADTSLMKLWKISKLREDPPWCRDSPAILH